ncbi:glycogenin-2 isoform X5 [Micropterus salmoides]|uniref:glycogenin-2 isoform X5 n=1 Tax=Micropterus salmoides TaxID=27706 RepID=UPI0018EC8610|nr:glycogenin-2 isoform X5 [Micropterus salmoides]XP_038578747.1 glycogenin-2 isoform X5 [Micropterus salmoides]XP_038578757.1 glycogenin-2 isoform X5 [Micropterus salmoides]
MLTPSLVKSGLNDSFDQLGSSGTFLSFIYYTDTCCFPTKYPAEAFVTLATTDPYCMGAIVVARSLRRHGTTRSIVVMVTPNVSEQSRLSLKNVFDEVIMVDVMDSEDPLHLALLRRPELGITFTKIHCWTLTQYSKCVFLDADTLVLCNVDELFERDELSAAPDPGWPDCFNSGVFVFIPSLHTHTRLLNHTLLHGSFDGGDQGLLNSFFSSWPVEDISKHLPFVYNLSASSFYTYLPAFQQFGHNAKIVHFLGVLKPWSSRNQRDDSHSHTMEQFVSLWWTEYLSFPTMSLPGPQSSQDCEKPKPWEREHIPMCWTPGTVKKIAKEQPKRKRSKNKMSRRHLEKPWTTLIHCLHIFHSVLRCFIHLLNQRRVPTQITHCWRKIQEHLRGQRPRMTHLLEQRS